MTRLLCLANFPAGTGYAWDHFEKLVKACGGTMAWPSAEGDYDLNSDWSVRQAKNRIRNNQADTLLLFDRPARHWGYRALRAAGIKRIVVYDQTSGERTVPSPLKALAKRALNHVPGLLADRVVVVSDYVGKRQRDVACVPPERIVRIWNGIEMPEGEPDSRSPNFKTIVCVCRAEHVKGVQHLIRAFAQVMDTHKVVLTIVGDGPALDAWKSLAKERGISPSRIHFAGYSPRATEFYRSADIAVVPSLWQEAFGLAALEPMARGIPVIASAVGGIPEIIHDGLNGILVPPGSETRLADALTRLLNNPADAREMGECGRKIAQRDFTLSEQVSALAAVLEG